MDLTLTRLRTLPFFWLSLAFLAGIILASQVSTTYDVWLILAGVFLLFALRPKKPAELITPFYQNIFDHRLIAWSASA